MVAQYELYSINISRVDLFYIKSYLCYFTELFHREFQSITLQLIHNNLLHFTLIQSTLCSRAVRWNYKTTEYVDMKGILDSIEWRMLRRADYMPAQNPPNISTDSVTQLGMCDSPRILCFHAVYSPQHSQLDGMQNTLHT